MKNQKLLFTIAVAAALSNLSPSSVWASGGRVMSCQSVFAEAVVQTPARSLEAIRQKDFGAYWRASIEKIRAAKPESSIGAQNIESWILAHFFFDRIEVASATKREFADLIHLWDVEGSTSPFLPFKKTFQEAMAKADPKLASKRKPLTFAMIKEIHRSMMDGAPEIQDVQNGDLSWFEFVKSRALFKWGHIDGIKGSDIGKLREQGVGFLQPLAKSGALPHFSNPYLSVKQEGAQTFVSYATVENYKKFEHALSPNTLRLIAAANASKTLSHKNSELSRAVITDLLNEAFRRHASELSAAKNLDERVEAHSNFVWRFVSIHPFINGNGRTSRALLAQLLMQEGLTPPLFKNQNDVTNSMGVFAESVKEGIALATTFMEDVMWRAENGWEPTKSPVALLARLPKRIYFDSQQDEIGRAYADVDVYDFAQFLRLRETSSVKNETELLKAYVAHLKRWTGYRVKTGEEYQVRFVPAEMQQAALQIDAANSAKWKTKTKLFYSNELAWRGLAVQNPMSVEGLLDIFVKPERILLSMNSSRAETSEEIYSSIAADFDRFNQAVLEPKKFFEMTSDHMKAEGGYSQSPLLSAAMVRAVADRFSKGFLTGEEQILSQKGQLVVAALAPDFGTSYFNRLGPISKRMNLGFVSKYPRQMEIAIAGIMAPDSVMRVEYRDVKVREAIKNTGELIAGETDVLRTLILERDASNPAVITMTTLGADGNISNKRLFRIALNEGIPVFEEMK